MDILHYSGDHSNGKDRIMHSNGTLSDAGANLPLVDWKSSKSYSMESGLIDPVPSSYVAAQSIIHTGNT